MDELKVLEALDWRVLVGLTTTAGILREMPVPRWAAIAVPTALGFLYGALGAWEAGVYEAAVMALLTGTGVTLVGRTGAAGLEASKR